LQAKEPARKLYSVVLISFWAIVVCTIIWPNISKAIGNAVSQKLYGSLRDTRESRIENIAVLNYYTDEKLDFALYGGGKLGFLKIADWEREVLLRANDIDFVDDPIIPFQLRKWIVNILVGLSSRTASLDRGMGGQSSPSITNSSPSAIDGWRIRIWNHVYLIDIDKSAINHALRIVSLSQSLPLQEKDAGSNNQYEESHRFPKIMALILSALSVAIGAYLFYNGLKISGRWGAIIVVLGTFYIFFGLLLFSRFSEAPHLNTSQKSTDYYKYCSYKNIVGREI